MFVERLVSVAKPGLVVAGIVSAIPKHRPSLGVLEIFSMGAARTRGDANRDEGDTNSLGVGDAVVANPFQAWRVASQNLDITKGSRKRMEMP